MPGKHSKTIIAVGLVLFFMVSAIPYINCAAETDLERRMRQSGEAQKAQVEKEKLRDSSHDNRMKTGKDTSVGFDYKNGTPTVGVKKTTK